MSGADPSFPNDSTLPLLAAFVAALIFLGGVVAIVTSGGHSAPRAVATATTEEPINTTPTVTTVRVTLTIESAGGGKGRVVINGVSRDCSNACRLRPYQATTVDLVARQAKGSTFVGWTGSCGSERHCLINMDRSRQATALFTSNTPIAPPADTKAECHDGFDNDGDGAIDEADYDCAIGNSETSQEPDEPDTTTIAPPPPPVTIPPTTVTPPPVVPPPPPPFVAPPPPPPFVPPPPPPPPPAPPPDDVTSPPPPER